MAGDHNVPFKHWHAVQWVSFVLFILTAIAGILTFVFSSMLSNSNRTSLYTGGSTSGWDEATVDTLISIIQKLEYSAGGITIGVVIFAMTVLFVPSKAGSSSLFICINVLACCATFVVIILAIVPTVLQLTIKTLCGYLALCYSCSDVVYGNCVGYISTYGCWYDSASYNDWCGDFLNTLTVSVILTWIATSLLAFTSIMAIVITCTLSQSNSSSGGHTVIVSQTSSAQLQYQPQPAAYPPQGYPPQGYPPQGYPPQQPYPQQPAMQAPPYDGGNQAPPYTP